MSKVPMTKKGRDQLQEELGHLKTVERQRIIQAIAEARAHGDLKENAEYHAANEQQSFIEGRIADVESKLSNAMVIEVQKLPQNGRVVFGVTVSLVNCKTDEESVYQLVGDDEANFKEGKISINSPFARAIIGKQEGDVVEVRAPGGNTEYEIGSVKYLD